MRIGITLPTFSSDADRVLEVAREAELKGIDGVFMFDHLWPIGDPTRPALSLYPTLAAVAVATRSISVGTLVARVGLLPDAVVLASLQGLQRLAGHRLVVAIGTGDKSTESENHRLGIPVLSAAERRLAMGAIIGALQADGIDCWVGAGSTASNALAQSLGAQLNFWDVEASVVAEQVARGLNVTWAGPLPREPPQAARRLQELRDAGATWVVWGWPRSLDLVLEAVSLAGLAAPPMP